MKALIVSGTVFFTILFCLALGVTCGYAAVCGVLRAFGHKQQPATAAALTAAHVSGD
ncbi:MAG TPA: hypothetical protein VFM10_03625 [Terriglobales bacterium]|nr:hypothetical protein [Terriglobales bacterium]